MRFSSMRFASVAFAGMLVNAAPISDALNGRAGTGSGAPPAIPVKQTGPPPVNGKPTSPPQPAIKSSVVQPGVAASSKVAASAPLPVATNQATAASRPASAITSAAGVAATAAPASVVTVSTHAPLPASAIVGTPVSVSSTVAPPLPTLNATDSGSCSLPYSGPDAQDISSRELEEIVADLERRARGSNEEYWFRWEDPRVADNGQYLVLNSNSRNAYSDQAYKWISMDIRTVERGSIQGRVAAMYVFPAGTAEAVRGVAGVFEVLSQARRYADYVRKAHEPGDIGIQGLAPSTDPRARGNTALNIIRGQVKRVVFMLRAGGRGSQAFKTLTPSLDRNGNPTVSMSFTASSTDQERLRRVWC